MNGLCWKNIGCNKITKRENTLSKICGDNMIYNDGTFEDNSGTWFVGYRDNVLYYMDNQGKVKIEEEIPLDIYTKDTYRANPFCIKKEDKIWLLPEKSKTIYEYDLNNKTFKSIKVELDCSRYSIRNAWVLGSTLWCLSFRVGKMIKIDLKTGVVLSILAVCTPKIESGCGEAVCVDDKIYIAEWSKNIVIEFDTTNENKIEHVINCGDLGFGTIQYDGKFFYLTGYNKCLYKCDLNNGYVTTFFLDDLKVMLESTEKKYLFFVSSKLINDYIFILPQNNMTCICSQIIILNTKTEEIQIVELQNYDKPRKFDDCLIYNFILNNEVYIQDYNESQYWVINMNTFEIRQAKMNINKEHNDNYWKKRGIKGIHSENELLGLENLISCLRG